jgi:hypothetical protein
MRTSVKIWHDVDSYGSHFVRTVLTGIFILFDIFKAETSRNFENPILSYKLTLLLCRTYCFWL